MAGISYKLDRWFSKKISDLLSRAQTSTIPVGEKRVSDAMTSTLREAAGNGIVLLENDGVLPLQPQTRLNVFGRCQIDSFYVGYGSGGDVNAPYCISYLDALEELEATGELLLNQELKRVYQEWGRLPENEATQGFWGHWPFHHPEMLLSADLVSRAKAFSEIAVVILGRAAGEDRDNKLKPGSYYLTQEEKKMLTVITAVFEHVIIVLNCGNMMDISWLEDYKGRIGAVLYVWQGGMENGHALADVIIGKVNPSAKLTDTIAFDYNRQPSAKGFGGIRYNKYSEDIFVGYRYFESFASEDVRYPFGYGLSYTDFSVLPVSFAYDNRHVKLSVRVKNTGKMAGREVVQVYASAPQGSLGKARYSLIDFRKTGLLSPGEEETLTFDCAAYSFSSYDDVGTSGFVNAYVLEKGNYSFFVGNSVRDIQTSGGFHLNETVCLEQMEPICQVKKPFLRIRAINKNGKIFKKKERVTAGKVDMAERILSRLPKEIPTSDDQEILLKDVAEGNASLTDFVAQLSNEELEMLSRGYGVMDAPQGPSGNAGCFGGITDSLAKKGIIALTTTDGPAGIRLNAYTSLLPCGTALASSWDPALVERVYEMVGEEMAIYGSDILLAPGMNIHRNPLCGRNFEYFSEDPLLSGKIGAAVVRGIQKNKGRFACPKHLCCNNQENFRIINDSRVSERALREIYLKGFELVVKESAPRCIMTSYNKVNSVWSHYNYDLATTLLRKEWGFTGVVITDWWMMKGKSSEFPGLYDNGYRVRAQVDVLMPGNMGRFGKNPIFDESVSSGLSAADGLTKAELQRIAQNVLKLLCEKIQASECERE